MLPAISLYQASLDRAKSLQIEKLIRTLNTRDEPRLVTPKQVLDRQTTLLSDICDPLVANTRLERILQGNELTDITYLAQGLVCARAVCRVVIRVGETLTGYGTGFLVAPGVLLTNHHVLSQIEEVRASSAQFRYERALNGGELDPVEFALKIVPEPILFEDLDMALVAIEARSTSGQPLDQFGWLRLNPRPGKAFVGEYLTIIQHPNGERKQVCVRENKLLKYAENGPFVWYQTDTVAGSSGSPVFNNSWEVVALHHSSVPKTKNIRGQDVWLAKNGQPWRPEMGESEIDWMANEGVRVSRICQYLQSEHGSHSLAQAVLAANDPPTPEMVMTTENAPGGVVVRSESGRTRLVVPVQIDINIGLPEHSLGSRTNGSPQTVPASNGVRMIEKVEIDQSNYSKRNGFNAKFLGNGFTVSLPKVTSAKFGKVLPIGGAAGEIRYWNYSVVVNQPRGLAYFSAANVDSSKFRGNRDADGDTWFRDTRVDKIDKKAQLGREFYKKQTTFEADWTKNPFDQGHLTSRNDLQWGNDDVEAKRNGDESYHYTNCSPQHWQFNQNNKASGLWFRLEISAVQTLSVGPRLCVMNGPVFDAPLSVRGSDGRLRLNLKGKRIPDGTFGGVKIPKMFFKVIAYAKAGALRAKAFVVTQEDLLATIDRYYPTERAPVLSDLEVRLYQVKIADLEALTNLSFGQLAQFDVPPGQESLALTEGLPITDASAIFF